MSGEMLCEKHHARDDCDLEAQQELEPDFDAKGETIPEPVFKYRFGLGMLALAGVIFLFGSSVGLGRRRLTADDAPEQLKYRRAEGCCVTVCCDGRNHLGKRLTNCTKSETSLSDMVDAKRGLYGERHSITSYNLFRIGVCGCGFDILDFLSCWGCLLAKWTPLVQKQEIVDNGECTDLPCCFFGFFWDGWCCDPTANKRNLRRNPDMGPRCCHQWNLFEIAFCGFGFSWSPCQLYADCQEVCNKDYDTKCCSLIGGYGKATFLTPEERSKPDTSYTTHIARGAYKGTRIAVNSDPSGNGARQVSRRSTSGHGGNTKSDHYDGGSDGSTCGCNWLGF